MVFFPVSAADQEDSVMTQTAGLGLEMRDMIIQTLRKVTRKYLPDDRILQLDQNHEFPEDVIQELLSPDVGLHLIFLPEETDGLGGGAQDIVAVSEEMAAIDLSLATAFLSICLGTDPIIVAGTPEQKSHWLGRIAREGLIVAYGVTEPEAGSNVAALKTVAEPATDDAGRITSYRLNGSKQFITNGGMAQLYTILAKAPGGPTFFVIERGTAGLSVGTEEDKHGIRSSNTASVTLEDVVVPVENLIGGVEGQGLKQANAVFGYTRLMVGAFGLGAGRAALERAIGYAKQRIQFGTPLIDKEGYSDKLLAPHWVDLEAGRAYVQEIARLIDDRGAEPFQVEGSIAKLWCTEAGNRAADAAIQALGGYGYTREFMVEKIRRDVRITTIYEGTSEIQQNIIAMYRWKETARSKGAFYRSMAASVDDLHGKSPSVGADYAAMALRDLNRTVLFTHEHKMVRRQAVMFHLADMMTGCEVAAAFCRKAAAMSGEGHPHALAFEAMSRTHARRVLADVRRGSMQCAAGYVEDGDQATRAALSAFTADLESSDPERVHRGLLLDMDRVTAHLKEL
jgi:alkylation response protein AidB-like acyl-CoA dehydrogenase